MNLKELKDSISSKFDREQKDYIASLIDAAYFIGQVEQTREDYADLIKEVQRG